MSDIAIGFRNLEISNSCDEFEWEDSIEVAREIVEGLDSKYRMMWISAGNIDWRGNDAYACMPIPAAEDFWSKIAGWDRADWTLRIDEIDLDPSHGFTAVAYSHDTPTGGLRAVTFLDGEGIYEKLKAVGWKYRDLVQEFKWRNGGDITHWSKEVIADILQNDLSDSELSELF